MSLLLQNTILRRWDGTRIWFPNLKLQTTPLLNLSRSDSKVEIFKVSSSQYQTVIAVASAQSALPAQRTLGKPSKVRLSMIDTGCNWLDDAWIATYSPGA